MNEDSAELSFNLHINSKFNQGGIDADGFIKLWTNWR